MSKERETMKPSEAILTGIIATNGRQMTRVYFGGADPCKPNSVCILGALNLGGGGCAVPMGSASYAAKNDFCDEFLKVWGVEPQQLNDEGMPLDHLYGMTVAAGL